jgi:hypothetical protein
MNDPSRRVVDLQAPGGVAKQPRLRAQPIADGGEQAGGAPSDCRHAAWSSGEAEAPSDRYLEVLRASPDTGTLVAEDLSQ